MSDASRYFAPGENFQVRPEWRRPAQPVYGTARVLAPGRLHFNVFDFSRMQPVVPGGGGLGTSTTTALHEVVVSVGQRPDEPQVPTARHLVLLFRELVGHAADDVHVSVPGRIAHVHSGFGSNVTFNTAVFSGLNALFGSPFSIPETWDVLTQNFVEVADEQRVYWGLETGVGESCLLYGGLVWVDEHCRYLGSAPTDGLHVVTASGIVDRLASDLLHGYGQAGTAGVGDQDEVDLVARECMLVQREHGGELRRLLERRMRPALLRGDTRALLELGWEMNRVGTYRVMERFYRPDVLADVVGAVRAAGGLYATMSSAGPSFFVLAEGEDSAVRLRDLLRSRFGEYFRDVEVGRAGTRLSVEVDAP